MPIIRRVERLHMDMWILPVRQHTRHQPPSVLGWGTSPPTLSLFLSTEFLREERRAGRLNLELVPRSGEYKCWVICKTDWRVLRQLSCAADGHLQYDVCDSPHPMVKANTPDRGYEWSNQDLPTIIWVKWETFCGDRFSIKLLLCIFIRLL